MQSWKCWRTRGWLATSLTYPSLRFLSYGEQGLLILYTQSHDTRNRNYVSNESSTHSQLHLVYSEKHYVMLLQVQRMNTCTGPLEMRFTISRRQEK